MYDCYLLSNSYAIARLLLCGCYTPFLFRRFPMHSALCRDWEAVIAPLYTVAVQPLCSCYAVSELLVWGCLIVAMM